MKMWPNLLCLALLIGVALAAKKPNIVFVLTDDMGYGEVNSYPANSPHGRIPTPNIDRMAAEGIRFTNAYAGETVCAPSRCSLMTGRHTGHTWIRGNYPVGGSDLPLRENDTTVAELLQKAGYSTALFGKWGLGNHDTSGAPWLKGFDVYRGLLDQNECHNMYPLGYWDNNKRISLTQNLFASRTRCMAKKNSCVWIHDIFMNGATDYIKQHYQDEKPFFLYLAFTDPHAGGWFSTIEAGAPVPDNGHYKNMTDWPNVEKDHAAQIELYEDQNIGTLLSLFKELNIDNNTIMFFASDNGAHQEGGHKVNFFDSTGGLRGFKRSLYEGGIRVPMIVRWPGHIPSGIVSDFAWAFWDFLPTALDLAGENLDIETDGISIVPTLFGKEQEPKDYLYWEFCTDNKWGNALRRREWKIVRFSVDSEYELYNLDEDPNETKNVAGDHKDLVAELSDLASKAHVDSDLFPIKNCVSS